MSFTQKFKDFFDVGNTQKPVEAGTILDAKVKKKTVVALGTMRAGKTTYFAGLGATAQYKSSDTAKSGSRFRVVIKEGATNILDDIAELRSGHFPPATGMLSHTVIKPGFTFEWETPTFFGSKYLTTKRQVDLPVIDYAGEQLVQLIHKVRAAKTLEQASAIQGTDQLTNTVNNCSALLPIINATRAEGLPIYKPEPYQKVSGLSKHPDINLARMFAPIIEYKHNNRQFSPPLERIGVVVTACDVLFPIAKTISNFTGRPFNPLDPEISNESLDTFVKAFFPSTHSLICSLNIKVQYFPSFFELEKNSKGEVQYWNPEETDPDKLNPKIKRGNIFDSPDWEHNVNRPKFSEYWFNKAIEWFKDFSTVV